MIQNLSLRSQRSIAFAEGVADKQCQDIAIASFRFAPFAMTIGHFFTWSTLNKDLCLKEFGREETIAFLERIPADYALFVQEQLLAIVEAKKVSIGRENVLKQAKLKMNSIFTPEEITALSAEIDRQLTELRHAQDSEQKQGENKISDEKMLVKQTAAITKLTQQEHKSFLQKFGQAAKSDLCQEGGMLNKQWKKWGDLDNKDAVERLGAVLVTMGFSGDVVSPLVVAVTVIVIHIGLKAFCEDYSSEVDNK